jgi:hypothetical protein
MLLSEPTPPLCSGPNCEPTTDCFGSVPRLLKLRIRPRPLQRLLSPLASFYLLVGH